MGLDMYLTKAPKIEGAKMDDLYAADGYMHFLEWQKDHPENEMTVKAWLGRELPDGWIIEAREKRGKPFIEQVAYWRKANQIHKWFSDKLADGDFENCAVMKVTRGQLEELLNLCLDVIGNCKMVDGMVVNGYRLESGKWTPNYERGETIEDSTFAQQNLPTESGFFFGSQEYDQYYMEDVKSTVIQIQKILDETDFEKEEVYYSADW